ncbi:MAG: multidrug transporter, partial [Alphaproteobacteria bacterium]|nr:multidrug transporter [Alphaproteobacteria bacterium]
MTSQERSVSGKQLLRYLLAAIVVVGLGGLVVWGFIEGRGEAANEAQRERPVKAPLRVAEVDGQPAVKLDAETLTNNGIEVAALLPASYQDQLRGYGMVLDLTQLTDLSNSYASARAQQQVAQAKLAASKTAFERARNLYRNQQNVSLAQFQAAEAAFQTDQAALAAAESQVRTLAATAQQTFGSVVGKALLDGSSLITDLIERQDFLLQVTLPPGVTLPAPLRTATVQVEGGLPATITFVSPATKTDPRLQGKSFFYLAPASSGVLPGMNVLVSLPSDTPSTGTAIPPSAILETTSY